VHAIVNGPLGLVVAMSQHFSAWTIEHRIPSELAAGHRVLDELLCRLSGENWSPRDLFGIRLSLEEAVVNAIKHGNCLDPDKHVHVECRSTAAGIWVRVADQGSGFDPEAVPDCTDAAHLDVPHGRGIMLMRNYMTRVEYNAKGNVVEMEKTRVASNSQPNRS
jgi:serine/threonine-protein kinase RsbW